MNHKKRVPVLSNSYFPTPTSDLYKSDWKLQGNTNTQLKLLCRASYTGN